MMTVQNSSPGPLTHVKLVRIFSYITIAGVFYGIAWAHVPFLIGTPWSTGDEGGSVLGSVLSFHLFDVPPALFNAYVGWYGLKRYSSETLGAYRSLLMFSAAFNFCFVTFETVTLQNALRHHAHDWEIFGLVSIALLLVAGTVLTVFIHQKLIAAANTA